MDLNLAGENFGNLLMLGKGFVLEIDSDGLSNVFQSRFDGFTLRQSSGQLGHVGDVAVVLGIEDEVDEESLSFDHAYIVQGKCIMGMRVE